jgi:nitrogen-specific signal transduction histidine kinase
VLDESPARGIDVGLIAADAEGRVIFASPSAHDILRSEESLDGVDVRDALALPARPAALLRGEDQQRWVHSLRAGDDEIEVELTVMRVPAPGGKTAGHYFVLYDRTREKKLEMEHRRFERLAAMGTMVAGFAHEVRNPMASLRSIAESLAEELHDAGVHLPHVARMLDVLERVERLVRASLLFGSPSPPRRAPHRPWELLSRAVTALEPRTSALGGELAIEADGSLPDVFVDEGQLVQVLVVLLDNALDATGSPQRVLLRAALTRPADARGAVPDPAAALVRFEVHDDGPGIPDDIVSHIFDPFFTTKAAGTGLGLSIAQQLLTENGGRIEIATGPGGPTVFTALVPVAGYEASGLRSRFGSVGPPSSSSRNERQAERQQRSTRRALARLDLAPEGEDDGAREGEAERGLEPSAAGEIPRRGGSLGGIG